MEWALLAIAVIRGLPRALLHALVHPFATIGLIADARRLGIVRVVTQEEVEANIPSIHQFLHSAKRSIQLPVYAPTMVLAYYQTLIDKANSGVAVTIIMPDPRNQALMDQLVPLTEGRTAFFSRVKSSLETLKACWQQVGERRRFRTFVTNAMPMFTAVIVDGKRGTVAFRAQRWPAQKRLLLYLGDGPVLQLVLETWDYLVAADSRPTELASEASYDELINAAGALK